MILRTALCLAVALTSGRTGARPAAHAWAAASASKGDPQVPAPGAIGERVEPATGRGRALGPFLEPRSDFQATRFPDGRVLVTGGSLTSPTSEWFDPATNRFAAGPALAKARQGHRALALKDGRLLLLGGTEAPAPAEILEPGAPAFRPLAGGAFALSADAVELDGGRVVMVDGATGTVYGWDGTHGLASKATLAFPRNCFRAVGLKDGRVAITGGWPVQRRGRGKGPAAPPDLPVECFNPRWSTLSTWTDRPRARARHQAILLEDGRICLWGGVGQDPDVAVETLEMLDLARETVTPSGTLDLRGGPCPAWARDGAGKGLCLPERGQRLLRCDTPQDLAQAPAAGRLANGYLVPTLVPLLDGGVLVLGTAAYGDPLDRWDARTREGAVVGTLRLGSTGLGLLPDGTVLALGAVVDRVDPRTGALTPLGWREDLEGLLRKLKPAPLPPASRPPFRDPDRRDALVVPLDANHALVVGGSLRGEPTDTAEIWDLRKHSLAPTGSIKTRRAKPYGLKLKDGSVLVGGAGKE